MLLKASSILLQGKIESFQIPLLKACNKIFISSFLVPQHQTHPLGKVRQVASKLIVVRGREPEGNRFRYPSL